MARESDFICDDWCASCGTNLTYARETGVSSLYFPESSKSILLCVSCYHSEDDLIEERGTNNQPELLKQYLERIAELTAGDK